MSSPGKQNVFAAEGHPLGDPKLAPPPAPPPFLEGDNPEGPSEEETANRESGETTGLIGHTSPAKTEKAPASGGKPAPKGAGRPSGASSGSPPAQGSTRGAGQGSGLTPGFLSSGSGSLSGSPNPKQAPPPAPASAPPASAAAPVPAPAPRGGGFGERLSSDPRVINLGVFSPFETEADREGKSARGHVPGLEEAATHPHPHTGHPASGGVANISNVSNVSDSIYGRLAGRQDTQRVPYEEDEGEEGFESEPRGPSPPPPPQPPTLEAREEMRRQVLQRAREAAERLLAAAEARTEEWKAVVEMEEEWEEMLEEAVRPKPGPLDLDSRGHLSDSAAQGAKPGQPGQAAAGKSDKAEPEHVRAARGGFKGLVDSTGRTADIALEGPFIIKQKLLERKGAREEGRGEGR